MWLTPDPTEVVLDLEKVVMQTVSSILSPHVTTQGCFFHLTQSAWRRIQDIEFVNHYRENDDCRLFCGMMDGLAFLPLEKVREGKQFLKDNTFEEFDKCYKYVHFVMYDFLEIMKVQNHCKSIFDDFHFLFRPIYAMCTIIPLNDAARTHNMSETWK